MQGIGNSWNIVKELITPAKNHEEHSQNIANSAIHRMPMVLTPIMSEAAAAELQDQSTELEETLQFTQHDSLLKQMGGKAVPRRSVPENANSETTQFTACPAHTGADAVMTATQENNHPNEARNPSAMLKNTVETTNNKHNNLKH